MSTSTVTPDQDSQAPNVTMTPGPSPSVLGQTVSGQMPTLAPQAPQAPQGATRLQKVLSVIANTVVEGLAGTPDRGRPSFFTGLGEGARSAQAAEATQQAIRFKTFDDSVRAASLHNQDVELQQHTQEQQDRHQAAQDAQHDWDSAHGLEYDEVPNTGSAVTDHLTAQTTANGAASIPAGTHLSADGKSILIPRQTTETQQAQLQKYNTFGPAFGLPSLPEGAQFVPPKNLDMLQHRLEGHSLSGDIYQHNQLPDAIADLQSSRDSLSNKGGSPDVLKQLDSTIASMKSKLAFLDDHAAGVKQQNKQAELDAENSPEAVAASASKAAANEQAKLNVTNSPANQDAAARGAAKKTAAEEQAKGNENLVVAYDPSYPNSDGTKGGNIVITKGEAQAKGLQHYKADGGKLSSTIGSFNDVQGKVNQLAAIATDPNRMSQVDPGNAAAILAHEHGLDLGGGAAGLHAGVDTSRFNEKVYKAAVDSANRATLDYVTAMVNAHEAITQLPRLQTFGQSSRMTQQQMEAAVNLLPHPGDGRMAQQKMVALQGQLDSLRKALPHMQGAELTPTWMEQQKQQQPTSTQPAAPQQSNLGSRLAHWAVGDFTK